MPSSKNSCAGPIAFHWIDSIANIPVDVWQECFGTNDVLHAYELHQATEAADLQGVRFHYLLAREAGLVVAILPCFTFPVSMTTVANEALLHRAVTAVRTFWPKFLYLDAFVVGTPIAICKDLIGLKYLPGDPRFRPLMQQLGKAVVARAQGLGADLVLFKEITCTLLPYMQDALSGIYEFVESVGTTYLFTSDPGSGSYKTRLRTKYRMLMNNRKRRFTNAGYRWEICHDFAPYALQMEDLYGQVLSRAKIRFETLNAAFFEEVSRRLGDRSCALLVFDEDRLIAFELILRDQHWLHPIYFGMSYDDRDEGAIYFNLIYKIVEMSEAVGLPLVQLGQTSYAAKASVGAVAQRLYLAVSPINPLLKVAIRKFGDVFFPPTEIPRQQRTFSDMEANNAALRRYGVTFEVGRHD